MLEFDPDTNLPQDFDNEGTVWMLDYIKYGLGISVLSSWVYIIIKWNELANNLCMIFNKY